MDCTGSHGTTNPRDPVDSRQILPENQPLGILSQMQPLDRPLHLDGSIFRQIRAEDHTFRPQPLHRRSDPPRERSPPGCPPTSCGNAESSYPCIRSCVAGTPTAPRRNGPGDPYGQGLSLFPECAPRSSRPRSALQFSTPVWIETTMPSSCAASANGKTIGSSTSNLWIAPISFIP